MVKNYNSSVIHDVQMNLSKKVSNQLKSILLVLAVFIAGLGSVWGQCTTSIANGATLSSSSSWQTISVNGSTRYAFNALAGYTYVFSFCNDGGVSTYDTYLTICNSSMVSMQFNDDYCSLNSYVSWTCSSSGTYYILPSQYNNCGGLVSGLGTLAYNIPPPPGENCTNAQNLALLSSPYSATTVGYSDDIATCRTGAPDRVFYIDVANTATITFQETTNDYDEWEYIGYGNDCSSTSQIQCWDNDALASTSWTNNTGSTQRVWYIQDAYSSGGYGTFTLSWSLCVPPSIPGFGSNAWNVICYGAGDASAGSNAWNSNYYKGYYTMSSTSFDTRTAQTNSNAQSWGDDSTPSNASGYSGCSIGVDNHSCIFKRQGFTCGTYQLNLPSHDDMAILLVDGIEVWRNYGCCATRTAVWTGYLGSTSTVELKVSEGGGGSHGALEFISQSITATVAGTNPTTCGGNGSITLSNVQNGHRSVYQSDFSSTPANSLLSGSASINSGELILTTATNSLTGSAVFTPSYRANAWTANYSQFIGGGNGADGICLSYGPISGAGGGESGWGTGLVISFDTHNGSTNSQLNIYWNNSIITQSALNVQNFRTSNYIPIKITVNTSNQLSVTWNSIDLLTNYALPAAYGSADKSTWNYGFSARTGGLNDVHKVSDLYVSSIAYLEYSTDGTSWSATNPILKLAGAYTIQARPIGISCSNTNVGSVTLTNPNTIDWANLQSPSSASICTTGSAIIYGRVYKNGYSNVAGADANMTVQVGYSSTNTNPNTWVSGAWSNASFNVQSGNNDEYQATLSGLAGGTYYFAFRYKYCSDGAWYYGGYNATGGGFWNGTTNINGTLTVNQTPAVTAMTATVCSGSGFTVTPVNSTNGIVPSGTTYSWAAPSVTGSMTGGATGSGAASITGTLSNPNNTAQTATYTVTPSANSCTGSTFTVTATISAKPSVTAMTSTACSGVGFTVTPVNSTNGIVPSGTTYSWAAPSVTGSMTGGATGSGAASITGTLSNPNNTAQTATYTVTPSANSCTGSTFTVTSTIRPQFSAGAINTTGESICAGGNPALIGSSVAASGGDNTITYKWQANGVDIASSNTATYDPPLGLVGTTTYTRLAKDGTCNGFTLSSGSWVVTVGNPTVAATLAADNFVWTGTTSTAWNVNSNWLQWNGTSYVVPSFPNANTANVILPATGSCVINTVSIPAATVSVNNLTVESGQTLFLTSATSILNIAGAFTMSGTWTSPTGGSIVNFNGAGNQSIPALSYSLLRATTGGVKSLTGTTSASGIVTIGDNTTLDLQSKILNLSATGAPFSIATAVAPNITGILLASSATVNYTRAGNQTIRNTTYGTLGLSGTGIKTLANTTIVNGLVNIGANITFNLNAKSLSLAYNGMPIIADPTASITFTGSTVSYTGTNNNQLVYPATYNNLTIAGTGSTTKTLTGNTVVGGTITLTRNLQLSDYSLTLNGGYLSNPNNLKTTTNSSLIVNCPTIITSTISNVANFKSLVINSTGSTFTTASNLTINDELNLIEGGLTLGAFSLTFTGNTLGRTNGTINSADASSILVFGANAAALTIPASLFSGDIAKLTVNRVGGLTLGSNTTVANTLTLTDGVLATGPNTFTMNGSTMTRTTGSIDASNLSSNLNFGNTNALTLPASSLQQNVNNLTLNGASGSLSLSQDLTILGALTIGSGKTFVAGNDTVNFTGTGNVLNVNGTFTPSTSTVNFANATGIQNIPALTYNKILSSNFGTRVLAGNVIANDDVTNTDGSLNLNDFNLTIGGNYSNSIGADGLGNFGLFPGIGSVIFNKASGSQTLFMEAGSDFSNIQHTGAGTLHLASDLTMTGNLTNTVGTISALSSDDQQSFGITIQGDWSNSAIFDPGTGYVLFTKSNGTQTVDNGTSTFYQMKQFGGASLTFSSTPEIKHDIVVNGPIATSSHFKLTGSNNQTISGSVNEIAIQDMTINKTAGIVTLSKPLKVSGALTMTAGDLITSSLNILEIGTSASSVGSVSWATGTVRGPMKRWFGTTANPTSQASGIFPLGVKTGPKAGTNRYAQVNFTSDPGTGGYIIAEYVTGPAPNNYAGLPLNYSSGSYPQAIQNAEEEGYWDITPYDASGDDYAALNSTPYTLKVRLQNPSTLTTGWVSNTSGNNLYDPGTIRLIRSKGSTNHASWELAGSHVSAADAGNGDYFITSSGITEFSWFNGGGNNQNPLPVELLSFNGTCNEGMVDLTWQTASEFNSSHFDVEKSTDGETWRVLATIPSAGTSNELLTYQTVDNNGTNGSNYYRLRQVDIDGKEKLYDPINVSCAETTVGYFTSYPNPSGSEFQVIVNNKEILGACTLNIVDAQGKVIDQRKIEVKDGINMFVISEKLNPGIYFLNITNGTKTTQVIKHAVK